jgi:hypothetical protein
LYCNLCLTSCPSCNLKANRCILYEEEFDYGADLSVMRWRFWSGDTQDNFTVKYENETDLGNYLEFNKPNPLVQLTRSITLPKGVIVHMCVTYQGFDFDIGLADTTQPNITTNQKKYATTDIANSDSTVYTLPTERDWMYECFEGSGLWWSQDVFFRDYNLSDLKIANMMVMWLTEVDQSNCDQLNADYSASVQGTALANLDVAEWKVKYCLTQRMMVTKSGVDNPISSYYIYGRHQDYIRVRLSLAQLD